MGFLAFVGSPYENFSSPFCEIAFQKRNTQIGQIRKSVTTAIVIKVLVDMRVHQVAILPSTLFHEFDNKKRQQSGPQFKTTLRYKFKYF